MDKKPKIFENLEKLAPSIPVPLYWFDIDCVFMGMNELCLKVTGAKSFDVFIGKNYYQVHRKDIADEIVKNIKAVINTGKVVEAEEIIKDLSTGKDRYFLAVRSPLHDEDGTIVGVIATSIDITDKKNAEQQEIKMKLIEYAAQDTKKTVVEMAQWVQGPLLDIKKRAADALIELEKLLVDPNLENKKKQISSLIKNIDHDITKVGNLVNGMLNKLNKKYNADY